MLVIHHIAAYLVLGLNVAVGVCGIMVLRTGASRATRWFPHLLAASQYAVVVVGLLGLLTMASGGHAPADRLQDDWVEDLVNTANQISAVLGYVGQDAIAPT